MKIHDIEIKIAEQQGIIIEAEAKLRAWVEVREAFSVEKPTLPEVKKSKQKKGKHRNEGITGHIYEVLPSMPPRFTSADLAEAVRKRLKGARSVRSLTNPVCSFLHSVSSGVYTNPKFPIKTCGVRDGRKLYTRK